MSDFRAGATEYTFLLDEDVKALVPLFPKRRVRTIGRLGLRSDAADFDIVRKAWNRQLIIVTANGRDFRRELVDFQRRGVERCSCLWDLVILPSGEEIQKAGAI